MDTLMNVLHVLAAVFLIGPMAVLPMTALRSLRAGQGPQVTSLAKSTFVFSLFSLLVAIFGFGVLGMSDPKYHLSVTTPWILYSLIAYVIALLLNLFVVVPAMRKAAAEVGTVTVATGAEVGAGSTAGHAAGRGGYSQISVTSGIVTLLLVLVTVLMVWKP